MRRIISLMVLLCLLAVSAARGEESPVIPELTARPGAFPKNQRYEVYEGPRQEHRRAGSGKAIVSTNGEILFYGTWLGRMMIEYEIAKGHHRIGWIDTDQLPASSLEGVPELPCSRNPEENIYGVVTTSCYPTSDPLHSASAAPVRFQPGTSLHVLAALDDWYLVECFAYKELRMGFIPQEQVDLEHGYVANPEWSIGYNTRYTVEDIHDAFDALAQCIYHYWPGTGLMAVRYDENDADEANPNPWWQDETGQKEGILLFADLNSMELWDYEIAGYGIAKDYQFYLYREPGGKWIVGNWGYT